MYGLNAKIAELESEMHDVVRELVRTNLDVQNIKVIPLPASAISVASDAVRSADETHLVV